MLQLPQLLTGQGVHLGDAVDLIAEHLHPQGPILFMRGEDLHIVASDPEGAALKIDVVAGVLNGDQLFQQIPLIDLISHRHVDRHFLIRFRRPKAVDAGDRGDDDHIPAAQQGTGGCVAHAINLIVDGSIFFDKGIGARYVGFRLVVVVVGDEILHGVVGKKGFHLAVELPGQGFVVGQNQCRTLGLLDHLGHGEGLAGACNAKQNLTSARRLQSIA